MVDRLSAVAPMVDDQAIAIVREAKIRRDPSRGREQHAQKRDVVVGCVRYGGDWLLGYHEDVRWRLRVDVAEGERVVVFVHDVRRDFASDDAREDRLRHVEPPRQLSRLTRVAARNAP